MIKGSKHSEKTRKLMRESGKKRIFTEKHRKNISESKKGEKHPFYGKHHSEETKKKMSKKNKGENNKMFGKKHSEETRKKMSEIRNEGYYSNNIPKYDLYAPKLEPIED